MDDRKKVAIRLLRIAEDLSQIRYLAELDHSIEQLRELASRLGAEVFEASEERRGNIQRHGTD